MPAGEAPAHSSVCALFLSPCAGGLVCLLRMWSGGSRAVPHAQLRASSLPRRVSVGAVVPVPVSAAPWLPVPAPCGDTLPYRQGGGRCLAAGECQPPSHTFPQGMLPLLPLRET